jgi:predicted PurR-regulated permease PerM
VLLFYYPDLIYLFLFAVVAFMVLDYLVRAFFEWKYTQYPKQAILTLTEMGLILLAIIIVVEFKLLGAY